MTRDPLYASIEELISALKYAGAEQLASILHHRMYTVAWTSRSELLDELHDVLTEGRDGLSGELKGRVQRVLDEVAHAR